MGNETLRYAQGDNPVGMYVRLPGEIQKNLDGETEVLDVGCGVGATACYLAKTYGCQVVGVDLRERMVERARERARRQGVTEHAQFEVGDVVALPFDPAQFDVVLSESVLTFVEQKEQALAEFVRVTRPGGRIGLNEEFWLQPPTEEVAQHARKAWDITVDLPTLDAWGDMLVRAGLQDVTTERYTYDARREATQVKRYSVGDMLRMFFRTLRLYLSCSDFRAYMANRYTLPEDFFNYLGYALFVSRVPAGPGVSSRSPDAG